MWICEPAPSCHRCSARNVDFLATDLAGAAKSMIARSQEITAAASGDGLRECHMRIAAGNIVEWNNDGSCVRPGPAAAHYEADKDRQRV